MKRSSRSSRSSIASWSASTQAGSRPRERPEQVSRGLCEALPVDSRVAHARHHVEDGSEGCFVQVKDMHFGLPDTLGYYDPEDLQGFKRTIAFQPRVVKQNRGSVGEGTWIVKLKSGNYARSTATDSLRTAGAGLDGGQRQPQGRAHSGRVHGLVHQWAHCQVWRVEKQGRGQMLCRRVATLQKPGEWMRSAAHRWM